MQQAPFTPFLSACVLVTRLLQTQCQQSLEQDRALGSLQIGASVSAEYLVSSAEGSLQGPQSPARAVWTAVSLFRFRLT